MILILFMLSSVAHLRAEEKAPIKKICDGIKSMAIDLNNLYKKDAKIVVKSLELKCLRLANTCDLEAGHEKNFSVVCNFADYHCKELSESVHNKGMLFSPVVVVPEKKRADIKNTCRQLFQQVCEEQSKKEQIEVCLEKIE